MILDLIIWEAVAPWLSFITYVYMLKYTLCEHAWPCESNWKNTAVTLAGKILKDEVEIAASGACVEKF